MYIEGKKNIVADALSRFLGHPSWASLIEDPSLNLQDVQAYRLPPQLLTILWQVASCPGIADTSEQVIHRLWRLEPQNENAAAEIRTGCTTNRLYVLSRLAAVHYWTVLGAFSGSRVGEYGQSKANRGCYSTIPISSDTGDWGGQPLAFIRADFTFWDA